MTFSLQIEATFAAQVQKEAVWSQKQPDESRSSNTS